MNKVGAELRRWRMTWAGVAFAVVMPVIARDSPRDALLLFLAGVAVAISLRNGPDSRFRASAQGKSDGASDA